MSESFKYDAFIAYARADTQYARQLYALLIALGHKVFLDTESLIGGDPWSDKIREAQHDSLLTLILISDRVDSAYFQKNEILEAIEIARKDQRRRVIPLYLSPARSTAIRSPLRPLQGIFWDDDSSLLNVAQKLKSALSLSKRQCEWLPIVRDTIIIVTGCAALPELLDRPFAYELKTSIDYFGNSIPRTFLRSIVMGDIFFLDHSKIEGHPNVITIGSPGMNAVTARIDPQSQLVRKSPGARWEIKRDGQRWALFGDRAEDTYDAVSSFKDKDLPGVLGEVWAQE